MSGKDGYEEVENCTKEDIRPEDLTKPCELFIKELSFNKALNIKMGTNKTSAKYLLLDINDISEKQNSPVEVVIKECQQIKFRKYLNLNNDQTKS